MHTTILYNNMFPNENRKITQNNKPTIIIVIILHYVVLISEGISQSLVKTRVTAIIILYYIIYLNRFVSTLRARMFFTLCEPKWRLYNNNNNNNIKIEHKKQIILLFSFKLDIIYIRVNI